MLNPKIPSRDSNKTNKNSKKSAGNKIWPFLDTQRNISQPDRVVCPLQFNRPVPVTGNLVDSRRLEGSRVQANDDREYFHEAIGPILAVAQAFGLLPLGGIRNSSPAKLSFKVVSVRTFYTISIIVMLVFVTITAILHMIQTLNADAFGKHGGIAAATAGAMFYTNSVVGNIMFFWLAPRWVQLQRQWRIMERQLDSNKHRRPRLRWKFAMITAMVMVPAAAEHVLSLIKNMSSEELASSTNATWGDYVELYTTRSHAFVLSSLNYTVTLGIFLFMISKIATFTWNFTDLFVMLVSTGLAERYKDLNRTVLDSVNAERSDLDWRSLREKYAVLSSLVKQADNDVSPIILLSFANNLYFICLQLLNGLSPEDGILTSIYFFGSFVFLLGRTIAVTLLTARINDQSKIALPATYNCPGASFTIETQRLQHQLTTDDVAMTGLKFFSITRNFMLAVAGAIVTYEVVLLQFNVAIKK